MKMRYVFSNLKKPASYVKNERISAKSNILNRMLNYSGNAAQSQHNISATNMREQKQQNNFNQKQSKGQQATPMNHKLNNINKSCNVAKSNDSIADEFSKTKINDLSNNRFFTAPKPLTNQNKSRQLPINEKASSSSCNLTVDSGYNMEFQKFIIPKKWHNSDDQKQQIAIKELYGIFSSSKLEDRILKVPSFNKQQDRVSTRKSLYEEWDQQQKNSIHFLQACQKQSSASISLKKEYNPVEEQQQQFRINPRISTEIKAKDQYTQNDALIQKLPRQNSVQSQLAQQEQLQKEAKINQRVHSNSRQRDFTSQIMNLPGPKTYVKRNPSEPMPHQKILSEISKKSMQAYYQNSDGCAKQKAMIPYGFTDIGSNQNLSFPKHQTHKKHFQMREDYVYRTRSDYFGATKIK